MLNFLVPFDLNDFPKVDCEKRKDDIIETKKISNKLLKDSKMQSKLDRCYYCGKYCESFCHSHTTPAFCLRNISYEGKVYYLNSIIGLPIERDKKGIKEAGTFQLICRDCDSKIFQDYENPENYSEPPSPKMLAQIEMKNNLKNISKRLLELPMYALMCEQLNLSKSYAQEKITKGSIDLKEFDDEYKKARKCAVKPDPNDYYIGFYRRLPYTVPIAFQGSITLIADLDGSVINNVYIQDPKYKMKNLSIAIFPFEESSVILLFVDKDNKKYGRFFKQLKKCSQEDQLKIINYIVFAYSEDYFLSPILPKEILAKLTTLAGKTTQFFSFLPATAGEFFDKVKKIYNFEEKDTVPNLLGEEFSLPKKNDNPCY